MDFKVIHKDGTSTLLVSNQYKSVVTSAKQVRKLCGGDTVTINLESAVYMQFQVGDTIEVFGTTYTMNQLPTVKKNGERDYEYTLVFEGLQYALIDRVFLMPDNTQGDNLMFDLKGMMDQLIDNINRGLDADNDKLYELGECPENSEYKNLSLTGKNCLQVLQQLCEEWDTEFTMVESPTKITINIGAVGEVFPVPFSYGRGGGVYELNREKGSSDIATRLFVYGGTQNLTYYRHNRLCLPNKAKNQSYVESVDAQAIYGLKEQVKNFDEIYPNRIGTITSVSGCDYNEFIDSTMNFDLNEKWANTTSACLEWLALKGLEDTQANRDIYFNDVALTATRYLMPGSSAKVHFNTGALAGYECDLHAYTHGSAKKFALIPLTDENGYEFPSKTNTAFRLAVGDEYVILDINLPQSYKDDAEAELQSRAQEYFATVCNPQPKYTLTIDPIALKHIVLGQGASGEYEIFKAGDLIHVNDTDSGVDADVRIDQFERDLIDQYDYKLTLTDEITYTQQVRTLIDVQNIKRVVEESKIYDVNRIRRGWKDAEELYNMVFDTEGQIYGEKIQPQSIDTMMLKVGARSQQFTLQNITFTPNYNNNPAQFRVDSNDGTLAHYSIDDDGVKTWNIASQTITGLADSGLYVYARCSRTGTSGTIIVSANKIVFDSEAGWYNFLIGTLNSVQTITYTDGSPSVNLRTFSATYGYTTINGRFIRTGVIESPNGGVKIDLENGTITGNITLQSGNASNKAIIDSLIGANSSTNKYGTCSTGASTTAKVVTLTQGSLSTLTSGTTVSVHFTYGNTASNPTLNVSGTGAKAIKTETGSFDSSSNWGAGATIQFTYNGTYWIMSSALSASTNASSAVTTAGQANTKATNAQTLATSANDKIDNLEIGGKNLLLNSSLSQNLDKWTQNGSPTISNGYCVINGALATTKYILQEKTSLLVANKTHRFTFSGELAMTSNSVKGTTNYYVRPYVDGQLDGSWYGGSFVSAKYNGVAKTSLGNLQDAIFNDKGNGFKKFEYVFDYNGNASQFNVYIYTRDFTGSLYIRNLKLETGNVSTDWTPAPEDVQEGIDLSNLQGTCNSHAGAHDTDKVYDVVCPEFKSAFLKKGTRIKVSFTFANTGAPNGETGYLNINSTGNHRIKWQGNVNNKPIWSANDDIVPFAYDGSYWIIEDEEQRLMRAIYTEAVNGVTSINGGLVLTKVIQCGEGAMQSGMSGVSSNDIAFWAGGNPTSDKTPVRIYRNGKAFFGRLFLKGNKGNIGFNDYNGNEMWELISDAVPTNYTNQTFTLNDSTGRTQTFTNASVVASGYPDYWKSLGTIYSVTIPARTRGAKLSFDMSGSLTQSGDVTAIAVGLFADTSSPNPQAEIDAFIVKTMAGLTSVTIEEQAYTYSFPYSASSTTYYILLYGRTSATTATVSGSVRVHNIVGTSVNMITTMGNNGMLIAYNATNYFTAFIANNIMNVKAHGNFDLPGVLWAGRIANDRTIKTYFRNAGIYASNDIGVSSPASNTFVITHRVSNGQCSFAIVPEASAQRTFYIARNDTNGTITVYFNGTITAFDLTIYGSN